MSGLQFVPEVLGRAAMRFAYRAFRNCDFTVLMQTDPTGIVGAVALNL